MTPVDFGTKSVYSFSITGTAIGGASYTKSGLTYELKCLATGGKGLGSYETVNKYPKVVGSLGATSTYVFPPVPMT